MNWKITKQAARRGFTLVEMLVVVLIIGILAGLISAAAVQARKRAKVAAIAIEIKQLSMALNHYKTQFGEYPPDFAGISGDGSPTDLAAKNRVLIHLTRVFPHLVINGANFAEKWQNLRQEILDTTNPDVDLNKITMDPSTALRFWLGGISDSRNVPIGFSKDPAHPFDNTTPSRIGPFFEFDPTRMPSTGAEMGRYYPPGVFPGSGKPYVYFRAETGQGHPYEYYLITSGGNVFKSALGAKPYWDDRNKCWVNDTSFQILCCGLDGLFGKENVYPSGQKPSPYPTGIGTDDIKGISDFPGDFNYLDDQTNFSSPTIGDDMP